MPRIGNIPPVNPIPPSSSDPVHLQNIILITNQIVSSRLPGDIDPSLLSNLKNEINSLSPDLKKQLQDDLNEVLDCDPRSSPPILLSKAGILHCDAAIAYCTAQGQQHSVIDQAKMMLEALDPDDRSYVSHVEQALAQVQCNTAAQVFNLPPVQLQYLEADLNTIEASQRPDQIKAAFSHFEAYLNAHLPYPQ
jgi:hypothetical protein